jgi:hypothetical protein
MSKKERVDGFGEDSNKNRQWLSLKEAESVFGVPRRTLANQILRGDLPTDALMKTGREWRVHRRQLEDHFKKVAKVSVRGF